MGFRIIAATRPVRSAVQSSDCKRSYRASSLAYHWRIEHRPVLVHRDRLHRLREQIEAGSPRPEFELSFDPLGLIAPALKPFAQSTAIEQEQPLTSPDRTMRIFLVVTNQTSISAFECQHLMRHVNQFRKTAAEGWDGSRPLQILVTGRSAFVAEISLSMRYDVVATLLGSVVLVSTIFFAGFRRWLPLAGMAFCLLLSCLVALTAGQLFFGRLSMISVGFCAILVGLGVDFAILTIGRYQQARADGEPHQQAIATSVAKLGRAVFFGALTTAVGFLALVLSGAMSFAELGVLIAIGIFVAGLFMCSILFLFVRERSRNSGTRDWLFDLVARYVRGIVRRPVPILMFSSAVLLLLAAIGFSPVPPLRFEANTRSLQPKNIRAGQALEHIQRRAVRPAARLRHHLDSAVVGDRLGVLEELVIDPLVVFGLLGCRCHGRNEKQQEQRKGQFAQNFGTAKGPDHANQRHYERHARGKQLSA